jgi:hypothetical protein
VKTFSQFIEEAFDSSYKFSGRKVAEDEYSYGFDSEYTDPNGKTKKSRIQVDIVGSENANGDDYYIWDIGFSRKLLPNAVAGKRSLMIPGQPSYDMTGDGDALKIFSTVMKIAQDFVKKEDPKYVSFAAEKPKGTPSKVMASREKLYHRMSKKYFGSKFNISVIPSPIQTTFYLERK